MRIIFCSDPLRRSRPDAAFEAEHAAAQAAGLTTSLVSYEALVDERDAASAVRRVEPSTGSELAVYRGWMLRPEAYARLYEALAACGLVLINSPAAYRHCHYLPESYEVIRGKTPLSVWIAGGSDIPAERIMEALRPLGTKPIVVKDFVKSQKHAWDEACYISSAADRGVVERVVKRFLELQGEDLNEGLVFREFVAFEPLALHSKSGMPLTKEYRRFFLDGQPLYSVEYWEEGDYVGAGPPADTFMEVAQRIQSRFFTMDVAKRLDDEWLIVELGDGQVAGLPDRADVTAFYRALAERLAAAAEGERPG